jgi:ParB-like chromosome segregation protein Spo0J
MGLGADGLGALLVSWLHGVRSLEWPSAPRSRRTFRGRRQPSETVTQTGSPRLCPYEEVVAIPEEVIDQMASAEALDSQDNRGAGVSVAGEGGDSSHEGLPCSEWALGLSADAVGPVEWWPPKRLKPYAARHVSLPPFRGSPSWAILQHLVRESGVREPLLVLPDGQVVDGVHRLELAKALGLPEVPVRVLTVPRPLRDSDRVQLETTLAVLAAGRRHIAPSRVQGLLLGLTQAELAAGVLNRGVANLRRGRAPAPGPQGPTQRALAASTGVSPRTVRRLVRVGREGPEDLRRAVASGEVSVKEADRRLAAARTGTPPSGPLILRARPPEAAGLGDPEPLGNQLRRTPRRMTNGAGRAPASITAGPPPKVTVPAAEPLTAPATAQRPAAVQAFVALCHELDSATERFRQQTAHWTGAQRDRRRLTIRQTAEHLSEQLEWMQGAEATNREPSPR